MKALTLTLVALSLVGSTLVADVNLKVCAGCHGANFEKSALGKSKIVANLSKEDITTALLGYKAGTYGGSMKGIMKGQVSRYSDDDLKAAAIKISKK